MPIIPQILCDGCHAVKKETNHWYTLTTDKHGVCVRPLQLPSEWSATDPAQSFQFFCGRFCLLEALTKWMDGMTDRFIVEAGTGKSR